MIETGLILVEGFRCKTIKTLFSAKRRRDWSLPRPVGETGRRNVGNRKERQARLCEFPGIWSLPRPVGETGRRNVGNRKERRARLCEFPGIWSLPRPVGETRSAGPEGLGGVSILPPSPSELPFPPTNDQGCGPEPMGLAEGWIESRELQESEGRKSQGAQSATMRVSRDRSPNVSLRAEAIRAKPSGSEALPDGGRWFFHSKSV